MSETNQKTSVPTEERAFDAILVATAEKATEKVAEEAIPAVILGLAVSSVMKAGVGGAAGATVGLILASLLRLLSYQSTSNKIEDLDSRLATLEAEMRRVRAAPFRTGVTILRDVFEPPATDPQYVENSLIRALTCFQQAEAQLDESKTPSDQVQLFWLKLYQGLCGLFIPGHRKFARDRFTYCRSVLDARLLWLAKEQAATAQALLDLKKRNEDLLRYQEEQRLALERTIRQKYNRSPIRPQVRYWRGDATEIAGAKDEDYEYYNLPKGDLSSRIQAKEQDQQWLAGAVVSLSELKVRVVAILPTDESLESR